MGRSLFAAVLITLLTVGGSAADDAAAVRPADDVDALVRALAGGGLADGPSPTARVNRLISAGDARLRPVFEAARAAVSATAAGAQYRPGLRRLLSFLYPSGERSDASDADLVDESGAVRIRRRAPAVQPAGDWTQKGNEEPVPVPGPLKRGLVLRSAARPDVRKLLAALDAGTVTADEVPAVAQALGETCSGSRTWMAELARRADADRECAWLPTALAWTGSPKFEPFLRERVETLASRAAEGAADAASRLGDACRALVHLRRDALVETARPLPVTAREATLAAVGFDLALAVEAAVVASAPESEQPALLASLCRRIEDAPDRGRPSAATRTELARLLAPRAIDGDPALRASVLAAARTLFVERTASAPDDDVERFVAYPDPSALLANLDEDLRAGHLVLEDVAGSVFDLPPPEATPLRCLRSNVWPPESVRSDPPPEERVEASLAGEIYAKWLRLSITNVGTTPLVLDPVPLRYASAEITSHAGYGGPGGSRPWRKLALTLGALRGPVAVPASQLVTLAPMERHAFVITLRPEDRTVEHVSVRLADAFVVRGAAESPPLPGFLETWVR